ncbi:MAG: hypothetical protein JXK05_13335 [Campylobacterales bacterium]|nr:hypothetical protein [Campylobacterales bacterium]
MGISDREIARRLELRPATLNEWKKTRTKLYQHVVDGFTCKELMESMETNVDEIKEAIRHYKQDR